MKIGQQIKKIRKDKKLSQKIVSQSANISQNYLSEIENGKSCSIETLESICIALEMTLSQFFLLGDYEDLDYNIIAEPSHELADIGIEYITLAKEFKDKKIPPAAVKKILEAFSTFDKE